MRPSLDRLFIFGIFILISIYTFGTHVDAITYKIPLVYSGDNNSVHPRLLVETNGKKRSLPNALHDDNLRGKPGQGYYIAVNIGTPPQTLNVLVDTGSSNFAVASAPDILIQKHFHLNESRTFKYYGTKVFVPYTQGSWDGLLGNDIITIPNAQNISVHADISCIMKSDKFFINGSNWQGILGLAYPSIARPNASVTPLFDKLLKDKHVSNVFSLQLCGESEHSSVSGGTMTIGGIDPKLYLGEITYAPLHREFYYEVILTDITVGDMSLQISCKELNRDKSIVDSGTTNFRLPRRAFSKLVETFKRQVNIEERIPEEFWSGESFMCWSSESSPWKLFPKLHISIAHFGNSAFTLLIPPQQYLREVGETDSPTESKNCYKFAINPSDSGAVIGTVIMEGFYVIFDRQNRRLGFSKSRCANRGAEFSQPQIIGPFPFSDPMQCAFYYSTRSAADQTLMIVAYAMAGLCGLCLIPLIIMVSHKWVIHILSQKQGDHLLQGHQGDVDTATLVENDQ